MKHLAKRRSHGQPVPPRWPDQVGINAPKTLHVSGEVPIELHSSLFVSVQNPLTHSVTLPLEPPIKGKCKWLLMSSDRPLMASL